jgi:hypothetical protein
MRCVGKLQNCWISQHSHVRVHSRSGVHCSDHGQGTVRSRTGAFKYRQSERERAVSVPIVGIRLKSLVRKVIHTYFVVSRDSSVGIATRYGLNGPGIESRWGEIFSTRIVTLCLVLSENGGLVLSSVREWWPCA